MNQLSTLQKRAGTVSRAIFASLPLRFRILVAFERLADLPLKSLGRALGAVFILKGTKDLPDIKGEPALNLNEKAKGNINALTRMLPSDYLESFALEIKRMLMAKFKNEDLVSEGISRWLMRFVALGGWKGMQENLPLKQIKSYVTTSITREIINKIKGDKHEREQSSLDERDDNGRSTMNPSDPKSVKDFLEEQPLWKAPRVRRLLEQKAHPDAPMYLDLLMEGYTTREIVGDHRVDLPSMLPHVKQKPVTPQAWEHRTMPKIVDVLRGVAEEEAA